MEKEEGEEEEKKVGKGEVKRQTRRQDWTIKLTGGKVGKSNVSRKSRRHIGDFASGLTNTMPDWIKD